MKATISIADLRVSCLIGCLARERLHPQTLRLDLDLEIDAQAAGESDRLQDTWDYAALARDLSFILQQGRFYLLEAAAKVLLQYMLAPPPPGSTRPRALSASIQLTKFGVLPGQATPTVTLSADADELSFGKEQNAWGDVDVIAETRLLGLYRLNVAPGGEIPHHLHRVMREAELVQSEGLVGWIHDGPDTPLSPGTVFEWEKELAHGYRNTSAHPASILCLDSPPFQPADEVTLPRPTGSTQ